MRPRAIGLLLTGFVLSSCGFIASPGPPKVSVDNVPTDIIFGAPKPGANGQAQAPLEQLFPSLFQPPPDFFSGFAFPPIAPVGLCPAASPTTFPAEVADSNVTKMPAAGMYRWSNSGTYDFLVLTTTVALPLPMFNQHYVRKAAAFTDKIPALPGSQPPFDFTYETIEPHIGGTDSYLFSWQVKANSPIPVESLPTGQSTPSDPEGGLVLKKITKIDSKGATTGTVFDSGQGPGVLLLPLPVSPGQSFNSTSIDTSGSLNNFQLSGKVGSHENVDACGEPIQAWAVDSTLTVASTSGATTTLHYDVATQLGALLIGFNIDGSYLGTTFHKAKTRLGQAKGDPLPDNYK